MGMQPKGASQGMGGDVPIIDQAVPRANVSRDIVGIARSTQVQTVGVDIGGFVGGVVEHECVALAGC